MKEKIPSSRRKFLQTIGTTTLVAGVVGVEPLLNTNRSSVRADHDDHDDNGGNERATECARIRRQAAQEGLRNTPPNLQHPTNHDEQLYPTKIASYSKGLPHNADGARGRSRCGKEV